MKLTRHNGRAGKNGVYNPKHNDRSFDIANSEHIDEERAKQKSLLGLLQWLPQFEKIPKRKMSCLPLLKMWNSFFYRQRYRDFVTGQNERNVKNRHPERIRKPEITQKQKDLSRGNGLSDWNT